MLTWHDVFLRVVLRFHLFFCFNIYVCFFHLLFVWKQDTESDTEAGADRSMFFFEFHNIFSETFEKSLEIFRKKENDFNWKP